MHYLLEGYKQTQANVLAVVHSGDPWAPGQNPGLTRSQ